LQVIGGTYGGASEGDVWHNTDNAALCYRAGDQSYGIVGQGQVWTATQTKNGVTTEDFLLYTIQTDEWAVGKSWRAAVSGISYAAYQNPDANIINLKLEIGNMVIKDFVRMVSAVGGATTVEWFLQLWFTCRGVGSSQRIDWAWIMRVRKTIGPGEAWGDGAGEYDWERDNGTVNTNASKNLTLEYECTGVPGTGYTSITMCEVRQGVKPT
jgi:hypothetical protein